MRIDQLVAYFGYGSLVNRRMLHEGVVAAIPARLKGWRRHWQARGDDMESAHALLSVHREEASAIDGLLIFDRVENLPAIDRREARYVRVSLELPDLVLSNAPGTDLPDAIRIEDVPIHVYVGHPPAHPTGRPRLLQSYLDVVLSGFLAEFGHKGIDAFIQSTDGFERGIHLDRESPVYSRAIRLETAITRVFDERLRKAGVIFG